MEILTINGEFLDDWPSRAAFGNSNVLQRKITGTFDHDFQNMSI
jgi:hypothetical protein